MISKNSKYGYPLNIILASVKNKLTKDEIATLAADEELNKKWSDTLGYLGYSDRNKEIAGMYLSGGKTLKEVGDHFGITGERVRDIAYKILSIRIRHNENDIKYILFNGLDALNKKKEMLEVLISDLPIDPRIKKDLIKADIQTLKELSDCDPLKVVRTCRMDVAAFNEFMEMMDDYRMVFGNEYLERMKRASMLQEFYAEQPSRSSSGDETFDEPKIVDNPSVEDMPISNGAKKVLLKANIHSLNDLMECEPADIAGIRNMTMTFMKEYISAMEHYGMPIEQDQIDQMKKIFRKQKQMLANKDQR